MSFTLQAFKEDALASDMTDSASSLTLVAGAFGTPTGEQMLVIDPDIAAKREIVKCTIDGTAVTSIDRAQDGTAAVAHSSGAKVIMAFVPSHYTDVTNNGVLGYAEKTTPNQTGITTEADITGLSATVTVPAGGRKVRITGSCNMNGSANYISTLRIKEGDTQLKFINFKHPDGDNAYQVALQAVITPTAGSHTYKLTAAINGGNLNIINAATDPSFILVEYLGGS